MSNLIKLGIALTLGVAAGILNAVYLNQSSSFVSVRLAVKRGEPILMERLVALRVRDEQGLLKTSFIPWQDRNLLLQLRANRNYQPGDVLLRRDIEEMFAQTARKTETLRFRVIAVGDKFKKQAASDSFSNSAGAGSTVTIAVKQPTLPNGEFDAEIPAARMAKRMVSVVTRQMTGKEPLPEDQILGVAVFPRLESPEDTVSESSDAVDATENSPKPDKTSSSPIELPAKDEMALTISLNGIESVPAVILVGGEIGFFMYPEYSN